MNVKKLLSAIFKEVIQEAENNPAFRKRLESAAGLEEKPKSRPKLSAKEHEEGSSQHKRPSNRRAPAMLDPVQLAKQGNETLRAELAKLDIEQLRDVVAEYGMDTGKLVMKWRDRERIIERIVEVAANRAQKGSAFIDHGTTDAGDQASPAGNPSKNEGEPRQT